MAIDWWSTGLALAGGIPTAIAAIAGVSEGAKKSSQLWDDWRKRKESLKGPEELWGFYVKTTHVKHVIREEATEVTKLRTIRALQEIRLITVDHIPEIMKDSLHSETGPLSPDFFAIPGVAYVGREGRFLVALAPDQVFKSRQDHIYVLVYKIPLPVDKIFPNPEREFTTILRPLGTESLTVEMHFPPTRDLKHNENGDVSLELHEIRATGRTAIEADRYRINVQARVVPPQALEMPGNQTDMFRLTIPRPPQDADIEIAWHWSKREKGSEQ